MGGSLQQEGEDGVRGQVPGDPTPPRPGHTHRHPPAKSPLVPDSAWILRSSSQVELACGGDTAGARNGPVRPHSDSHFPSPHASQAPHLSQPPLLPGQLGVESSPRRRVESGWPPPSGVGRRLIFTPRTPIPCIQPGSALSPWKANFLLERQLIRCYARPPPEHPPKNTSASLTPSLPSQLTVPEMPPATKLMPSDVWSFGLSPLSQLFTSS